jgi:PelA/Pel-15E family pectate lyase
MPLSFLPRLICTASLALSIAAPSQADDGSPEPLRERALATMKRASEFMLNRVSVEGGYVWSYLPDFSRRWGELEAKPSQVWVQPPGTATMGHIFLDAFYGTGDEFYLSASERAAAALIRGQHSSGGWNYLIDFAGEASLRDWYETVGKNAWRLEEFHHLQDNATFDDGGTAEAANLILRLALETGKETYRDALERCLQFILKSQYPIGGWPQRYPPVEGGAEKAQPHYSSYITFNDDVAAENITFLLHCYRTLERAEIRNAISRAMNAFLVTQGTPPQAGWALQYDLELKPAAARTYEPRAYATHTTADNIRQLFRFYELTADPRFLTGIPSALDWLDSVRLSEELRARYPGATHPTFIEVGTNRPLFLHRTGSNVKNGRYVVDYTPGNPLGHYSSVRSIDTASLRQELERLRGLSSEQLKDASPLLHPKRFSRLPRFFVSSLQVSDLNTPAETRAATRATVSKLISELNEEGYWPVPLRMISHPVGGKPRESADGEFASTRVGDESDTSPFPTDAPVLGISTGAFVKNMAALLGFVASSAAPSNAERATTIR